jgi:hypothetical protein
MLELSRLGFEVIVLGLMACLVGVLLEHLTGIRGALMYFVIGATLHLGFELVGANKWYCDSRGGI